MYNKLITGILFGISFVKIFAQNEPNKTRLFSNKFSLVAGLIQPLVLKGGNIEINYATQKMIFDYSHGFSLDPPASGQYKDQNLALHLPYSTGFGIGYRINSFLDIRVEPKLHSWEIYKKDQEQTAGNRLISYKTFTLGAGIYYRYFPFKNSKHIGIQGITLASSLRYWPKIGTTLSKDKFSLQDKNTGETKTIKAANIGMANTPLIINVSVGYTFGGKN